MKNLFMNGAIHLFGDVGDTWSDDNFTSGDVAQALAENGDGDVSVRLNSGGGIANEGMAIYSLLKAHPGKVNIAIDGMAASAASLIAMAGDTRTMRDGAMMMIHDPSAITVGNAALHAKNGAALNKLADNYAGVYARASGKTPDAARGVMQAETWLTADEAVAAGFATGKIAEAAATMSAFDYRIYMHAPAGLPIRELRERAARQLHPTMTTTKGLPSMTTQNDTQEKPWGYRFLRSAESSGIAVAELNAIVDASASLDIAKDSLLEAMAKAHKGTVPNATGARYSSVETFDNPEFLGKAISDAIYCRMSGKAPEGPAKEWAGRTLLDMGVAVAQAHGQRISWSAGRHSVATAVMSGGYHSTSDFPNLLQSTGNRFLLEAYQVAQTPLKQLARTRVSTDFRPINVLRLGEAPSLLQVDEGAEVQSGTTTEKKESYAPVTFARTFSLSRQAIINDDLGAFSDQARRWGLAAAMCEADAIAALFLANSGNGANLSDGNPLYTSGRGNKSSGAGSILTGAAVGTGQQALRNAKGLDGKTPLNLVPKFLLVGALNEQTAQQICAEIAPTKLADVNPFAGLLSPLVEPRFTDASWRLFADPAQLPALEIAYINGQEGPIVEQKEGWSSLGMEFRCILDLACGLIEFRPTFYGVGA